MGVYIHCVSESYSWSVDSSYSHKYKIVIFTLRVGNCPLSYWRAWWIKFQLLTTLVHREELLCAQVFVFPLGYLQAVSALKTTCVITLTWKFTLYTYPYICHSVDYCKDYQHKNCLLIKTRIKHSSENSEKNVAEKLS